MCFFFFFFFLLVPPDPENNILRPRQVYLGSGVRDYKGVDNRQAVGAANIISHSSAESKRRTASDVSP